MTHVQTMKKSIFVATVIALQTWSLSTLAEPDGAADPAARAAAQEAFSEGDSAFDVQEYESALQSFRRSYEVVASPNSRLMVARCLLELGRLDEAYDEFLGVTQDAQHKDEYADALSTAERERDALLNRLAWLSVDMSALGSEAILTVAGRERSEAQKTEEIAVTPGLTLVEAVGADGVVAQAEVHLAAGRRASARLIPGQKVQVGRKAPQNADYEGSESGQEGEEPEAPTAPDHEQARLPLVLPLAIAAAGVGVGGAVMFGALGAKSRADYKSLQSACEGGMCPQSAQSEIDRGRRNQMLANVGLGIGIAGVAASGALFFVYSQRRTGLHVGLSSIAYRGEF